MPDINEKFPSNSILPNPEKPVKKKVEKVASGTIIKRKKNFLETFKENFFGDTTQSVGKFILLDVLIPGAKSIISDIILNSVEMILYGEPRRGRRDRDRTYVSYGKYYDRERTSERSPERSRERFRFDDIVFDKRSEAEEILSNLVEAIDSYGSVTVADFYDMAGINSDFPQHKYGWQNLGSACVERVREGYVLSLPRPMVLD